MTRTSVKRSPWPATRGHASSPGPPRRRPTWRAMSAPRRQGRGSHIKPAAVAPAERRWAAPYVIDVKSVLGVHRRGYGDPAFAVDSSGAIWRACQSPEGAGTLRVAWCTDHGLGTLVTASAWGEGA